MKTVSEVASDTLPSGADEKQLLLDCLLQDPKRSWLHYLDGRQALRVGVLLHLGKLSLPGKSSLTPTRVKRSAEARDPRSRARTAGLLPVRVHPATRLAHTQH